MIANKIIIHKSSNEVGVSNRWAIIRSLTMRKKTHHIIGYKRPQHKTFETINEQKLN